MMRDKTKGSAQEERKCSDTLVFSFQYLTKNKNHTFDYFGKDIHNRNEAYCALIEKLTEASSQTWQMLLGYNKHEGIEELEPDKVDLKPNPFGYQLGKNEKFFVMRFKNQEYRMLGLRSSNDATFHIFAFDFDFSAYKHGS